jgi:hypothetical protein
MFKNLFCIALRRGSVEPLKTGGFQSSKRLSHFINQRDHIKKYYVTYTCVCTCFLSLFKKHLFAK